MCILTQAGVTLETTSNEHAQIIGLFATENALKTLNTTTNSNTINHMIFKEVYVFVLYFEFPAPELNSTSDLAQCGATIQQFHDTYLSTKFALISVDCVENYSTIIKKPTSIKVLNSLNAKKRKKRDDSEGVEGLCEERGSILPTCFVLDLEVNKWRKMQQNNV